VKRPKAFVATNAPLALAPQRATRPVAPVSRRESKPMRLDEGQGFGTEEREESERPPSRPIRVAASGDLHARLDRPNRLQRIFREVNDQADILLLAGDLTDHGDPDEAEQLAEEMSAVRVPIVAVLGNHDYEMGKADEVVRILSRGGIRILDGGFFIFEKRLAIAGTKGFAGGFGRATLEPWGEEPIKRFVFEAVNESLKLESALARIKDYPKRIALMHYAPVHGTVEGENPELIPFLGCSRLAEPIDNFGADFAVHGHAHKGRTQANTPGGIPVYNVAMKLLNHATGRRFVVVGV
jgi:Icc-related predicted phosphoesterase